MKKNLTLIFLLALLIGNLQAQNTITPFAFIANSLCAGSTIEVPYTVSGTYNTGNVFTAQLSDEFGSFGSFTNIGSATLTGSGTINATIPLTINTGANYLIRIVSSNPVVVSPDNLIPLTYFAKPNAHFTLNQPYRRFLQGGFVSVNNLSTDQFNCSWDFGAGAIPGTDFSCAPGPFVYGSTGSKNINLIISSPNGCLDSFGLSPIEVFDCSPAVPPNAVVVAAGTVDWVSNHNVIWICAGGTYNTNNSVGHTIFVEAGGQLNITGGGDHVVYVKAGGSVLANTAGTNITYIYATGASIVNEPTSNHALYNCPSLTFSYCAAPLNGCFVSAPAASITASGPTTFCIGDSVELVANFAAGASYLWSNGATTQSVFVHNSGTYDVAVTYSNACTRVAPAISVTVNSQPSAVITDNGSSFICTGDSVILSAGNYASYLWSTGATTSTISSLSTDTYDVIITDSNGCKDTSAVFSVTVNPIPVITANGPLAFCSGDSVELYTDPGTSYLWSNGATTQSIMVHNSSTLTVTVNGTVTCLNASLPTITTKYDLPATTVMASGPLVFCTGGSVTLTSSPGASYLWSNGATTQSIQAVATDSFYVVIENANNCIDSSSWVYVTVNQLPDSTITPSGPLTFCSDTQVTLTGPAQMNTYLWTSGVMSQSVTQSIVAKASGTYGLTVRDTNNCVNSSFVTVQVNPIPAPAITSNKPLTFCEGDTVNLIASGGTSYLWSTGETTPVITVDTSGVYSVQVFTFGTCTAAPVSLTTTYVPMPVPVITSTGSDTICQGEMVTLYASGAERYSWSFGSSADSVIVNSTKNNFVVTGYNGPNNICVATTQPRTIFVAPTPLTYTTATKLTKCLNDTSVFTISPEASTTYQWHNNNTPVSGASNIVYQESGSGDIYAVAVSQFGCTDTSTVYTVSIDTLPTPVLEYNSSGYNLLTNNISYGGYVWTVNDTVVPLATGFAHAPKVNGMYRVKVRSLSGCYTSSAPFDYYWVSVDAVSATADWSVFPNPVSDVLMISTPVESLTANIMDIQGRVVLTETFGAGQNSVNVQNLPSGVYQLILNSGADQAVYKIQIVH